MHLSTHDLSPCGSIAIAKLIASCDGATGRVTNCPEANALLRHEYRKGWTLEG